MERLPFVYEVEELVRLVDADTQDLRVAKHVDAGFWMWSTHRTTQRFRLLRIDAPEVYGRNAAPEGKVASAAAQDWYDQHLGRGHHVEMKSYKTDNFGRWLADVYCVDCDGGSIQDYLIATGNAEPYED